MADTRSNGLGDIRKLLLEQQVDELVDIYGLKTRPSADGLFNPSEVGDCTGHAETNAVRLATAATRREVLATSTLYSSGEPCVMCAGAIFWSGIRRAVFGIDAVSLRVFRGEVAEQRDAELSCRDVFAASPHAIECIGPVLLAEASEPHVGF